MNNVKRVVKDKVAFVLGQIIVYAVLVLIISILVYAIVALWINGILPLL